MQQDLYVLIDIGGTAIKHGVATIDGTLLERGEMPTEAKEKGGPGIVQKVKDITKSALDKHGESIKGVSISTAGMVDPGSVRLFILYLMQFLITLAPITRKLLLKNFHYLAKLKMMLTALLQVRCGQAQAKAAIAFFV